MRMWIGLWAVMSLVGGAVAQAPTPPAQMAQRAAVIQPSSDEVRWQQIPWLTSLVEAQRVARQEQRPIFLWVTSDPPFDRC